MHCSTNRFGEKKEYMSPSLEVTELKIEGFICQSLSGGSEGTGDEPLFASSMENPDILINI